MLTEGMNTEQIIELAKTRPEFPWQWSYFIWENEKIIESAKELGVICHWGAPIRPGNIYLALGNTGPKLLTCRELGEACIHPMENGYSFDFSYCVLVQ